ncbi:MAG: tRNA (adenosine(37)-N6)-threonylcarbamoyltransferase complex transferase subunit TsaD [Candidatus Zambryskibacteria bacterium]|nr:tRNA (adenosine(37)-N6)-threonylcarbamoyltransferase complex transferase subunit TsaD [Candidatus Zambryskibacteria bacterium]
MKILAIETSCDETAIALLDIKGALEKPNIKILGNTLLSQVALHEQYGGVYPNLAKREHEKNLPPLLNQTLREARENPEKPDLDYIAVTNGPGLEPALWVGINFATTLGKRWNKPVIPVNHMEGHLVSVLFRDENAKIKNQNEKLELPALGLLVSGGHTELVYIKDFGNYEIIGRTRDDAVGEAFDKAARMLGLPYPGGPEISRLAEKARKRTTKDRIKLPRPMIHSGNLDFSFSGLKTAVLYRLQKEEKITDIFKEDMARAFEDAAVEVLIDKTGKALLELEDKIVTLIVAGGVSANTYLSQELEKLVNQFPNLTLKMPSKLLTTDNAIMIGIAAFIKISKKPEILKNKSPIIALGNLSLTSWVR